MPVGLSPKTSPPIKSESVAISAKYPNLSTFCWPPKHRRVRRPISLTTRSLSRLTLAGAKVETSIHGHSYTRVSRSGVVSPEIEVSSQGWTVRITVRALRVESRGYSLVGLTI